MAQLLPAYLGDLQKAAVEGGMEERKPIEFLERLLAVVTAAKARNALRQLQLEARSLFAGLRHEQLKKLKSFLDKRVPFKM